jgi:hypothetical protein
MISQWSAVNGIPYDIVCDEADIQGIMLFKKSPEAANALLSFIEEEVVENKIHVDIKRVRGGTILTFSLEAVSESKMIEMTSEAGGELEMTFINKLDEAFKAVAKPKQVSEPIRIIDFLESASKMVRRKRKNHDYPKGAAKGANRGTELRYESPERRVFQNYLNEALEGLATPTGDQPDDLFRTFARALRVLGEKMGMGPLQDRLTQQGISWKKSDDGQSIILTIKNAVTGADQPIARINYDTLVNPGDFEEQLKHMVDFASGDAPGAFEQKEQEIQDRRKAIGDIARAVQPKDEESEIAAQMGVDSTEEEAAEEAAIPKTAPAPRTAPIARR